MKEDVLQPEPVATCVKEAEKALRQEIAALRRRIGHLEKTPQAGNAAFDSQVANALMRLFAVSTARHDYLAGATKLLNVWSGCRYVGIRVLNQQGEIPFESYLGFSREFWEAENWLSIHRDQCLCIRLITGQAYTGEIRRLTRGGSFFIDNSPGFLAGLTTADLKHYRGTCMKCGFKSLGIVPLVGRERILGVMHLADDEIGKIDLNLVTFLEQIGFFLGQGLRKFSGDADRVAGTHLGLLMELSRHSISLLAPDGSYLAMNTAGHILTRYDGPEALRGRRITDDAVEAPEALADALRQATAGAEAGARYAARDRIGRPLTWESRFIPVKSADGPIRRIVCIAREVSDHRRAAS
jgi:PAS domain-containing protein